MITGLERFSGQLPGKHTENFTMYAVIVTGGKQYRVSEGDTLKVELLDAEQGSTVELDKVLMVGEGESVKIGAPFVAGGKVTATVQSHGRGDKIKIVKFRRRKHYQKVTGHRQHFTELKITGISAGKRVRGQYHGTQESRRQQPQRPRLPFEAPRRQTLRRPAGDGGKYPDPPARHPFSCRPQRRHRPRPHPVRAVRRRGEVRDQGRQEPHLRQRAARHGVSGRSVRAA